MENDTNRGSPERGLTTAVGLVALATATLVLARLAWWYGADMGWDGSGSRLRHPAAALLLCCTAAAAVVLATAVLVAGRRSTGTVRRLLVVSGAVIGALVPLTLAAYPHDHAAVLRAADAPWTARLPVTEVLGYRSQSATQIVLEGRADGRHCRSSLRAVTVDVADGTILDVVDLPTAYHDPSQVPPPPTPIDPNRFRVDQGSSTVVCSS